LERYGNKCQGCGSKDDLEVHHIDPVGKDGYGWHTKNRPENLIPLCVKCHGETRRKVEYKPEQLALF
jgi:5-methylcytosine-specific restriction endonuclease McrA